ncbi:hypothetical protein ACIA8C_01035 [Nocardia sp. NPDC051321]|uniref:hypothetical protein n=1 Tax=Nocardia sp. NPDC051321 TaxID=3364323 RepID=UPI0037BDBEF0
MRYQRDLLEFAVEWAPYDGGDEHVLPIFGLTIGEYYTRLLRLLATPAVRSLAPQTISLTRGGGDQFGEPGERFGRVADGGVPSGARAAWSGSGVSRVSSGSLGRYRPGSTAW